MVWHASTNALAELQTAVADLRRRVTALEGARSRATVRRDVRLLTAVAHAADGSVFTAAEVLANAALVSPALQRALASAGIYTAQQLGKRLQRLCGCERQGLRLDRVGVDHSGALWCVRVVP